MSQLLYPSSVAFQQFASAQPSGDLVSNVHDQSDDTDWVNITDGGYVLWALDAGVNFPAPGTTVEVHYRMQCSSMSLGADVTLGLYKDSYTHIQWDQIFVVPSGIYDYVEYVAIADVPNPPGLSTLHALVQVNSEEVNVYSVWCLAPNAAYKHIDVDSGLILERAAGVSGHIELTEGSHLGYPISIYQTELLGNTLVVTDGLPQVK